MIYFKNDFFQLEYNKQRALIIQTIFEKSEQMSTDEYKFMALKAAESVAFYKAKCGLADARKMRFVVHPEIQLWIAEVFFGKIKEVGTFKKLATILPEEENAPSIEKLSVEQTNEEIQSRHHFFEQAIFKTIEDAMDWLKDDDFSKE